MNVLINDILLERQRQIKKYGEQHHSSLEWLHILGKEMDELEGQVLAMRALDRPLYNDVTQVAATALAWMEDIKRGTDASHIQCPRCGRKSYNEHDIKEKYCGHCHQFHEFLGDPEHDTN